MFKLIATNKPELDKRLLALWEGGHIESVTFDLYEGKIVHWLDSGEVLSDEPLAWMDIPRCE